MYNATNVLLVDLIPKVGEKVVVCGGQPLTSRLTCLVLEGDDPGGQIKTPIISVKKVQGGDNMPYFRPHTVEDLRRSWILDHTNIHLDRISHFLYKKVMGHYFQVSGASLTLLGGSLNPQGVLEVHLSSLDKSPALYLNTRLGLTGQWWRPPPYQHPLWLHVLSPCQVFKLHI